MNYTLMNSTILTNSTISTRFRAQHKKNCKPVSRILYSAQDEAPVIYLDRGITAGFCAAYPPCGAREQQAFTAETAKQGVHGISIREVYPPPGLLRDAVRSYRTFSPLPRRNRAVIFCDTLCTPSRRSRKKPHPLGGAALCIVRTFLPHHRPKPGIKATRRLAIRCKGRKRFLVSRFLGFWFLVPGFPKVRNLET